MLVYLLIVVNFQSWLDPFIIITALPAALAGIVWMLFLTHTPMSVPALTGAIMCMGVATANSVLVISFARERMNAGDDAAHAALQAGSTRFRPVLMTALAMIIGMVPMALGLGEGGEQNAPLGRAVIGGLVFATVATLFFVPTVFSLIHGRRSTRMSDQKSPRRHRATAADAQARRYALIAVAVALMLAIWGIVSRLSARNALEHQAASAAAGHGARPRSPNAGPAADRARAARRRAGLLRGADLRAHQRLPQGLAYRHRHAGDRRASCWPRSIRPEVDQQLRQAQADLATAQANYELARTTNERWKGLLATQSVSQQDADQRAGDAAAKAAARQSAAANLARLQETGVVQARARALRWRRYPAQHRRRRAHQRRPSPATPCSASPTRTGCASTSRSRSRTPAPCSPGQRAGWYSPTARASRYTATVAYTANALDASSRTLQVELQIDNASGELLPGSYGQVHFNLPPA